MNIDHVLYGVRDLADATDWFASAYGLHPVTGGAHPQFGTANAIIPVGAGQYVELMTVTDKTSTHPLAAALAAVVEDGDRPFAVCLRPDDLDETARRCQIDISDGERVKSDGSVVRWRMGGIAAALGANRLPFFIEWPGGGPNPELDGVAAQAAGVDRVEIGGDPDTLLEWVGASVPAISTVGGAPGVARFSLRRADGSSIDIGPR